MRAQSEQGCCSTVPRRLGSCSSSSLLLLLVKVKDEKEEASCDRCWMLAERRPVLRLHSRSPSPELFTFIQLVAVLQLLVSEELQQATFPSIMHFSFFSRQCD